MYNPLSTQKNIVHSSPETNIFYWTLQTSQQDNIYLDIIIPFGEISHENWQVVNIKNLANYQGVITPRYFQIATNDSLIDLDKFNNSETDTTDIVSLANKLLASPKKSTNLTFHPVSPLMNWILWEFQLQCLTAFKLSDVLCNQYLDKFYREGMLYSIGNALSELDVLYRRIPDKEPFCQLLYDTTLYQKTIFPWFDRFFDDCGTDIRQQYTKLKSFIEIENELDGWAISNAIYPTADLNMYKLLSILQTLNKNVSAGIWNKAIITEYFAFLQNLLNTDNGIGRIFPPLYKDLVYWFNTVKLLPNFQNNSIQSMTQSEKNYLFDTARSINKWGWIDKRMWLEAQITTLDLLTNTAVVEDFVAQDIKISSLISQVLQHPNIKISNYEIAEDEKSATFQVFLTSNKIQTAINESLAMQFTLILERWSTLYLKDFTILNYPDFWTFLEWYLWSNISFTQFLSSIDSYISIFKKNEQVASALCDELATKNAKWFVSCWTSEARFERNWVSYIFNFKDDVITSVSVSDEKLNIKIQEMLSKTFLSKNSTSSTIKEILDQAIEVADLCTDIKLIIDNRVSLYLQNAPISIDPLDDECKTFRVVLQLTNVMLWWEYHIENNTIYDLEYIIRRNKQEKIVQIKREESPQTLIFPLNEENKTTLAFISNNAKAYLKLFDPVSYFEFERLSDTKNTDDWIIE